jgi:glycosyltransferase involved in cell wall biosynthesis
MYNPQIIIWSPGYNSKAFVASNIMSVASQTYKNYLHIIADDATNDGTSDIIETCKHPKLKHYRNETNKGWLWNALEYLDKHVTNDCIIVSLDLDDWLAHNRVLEELVDVYEETGAWITYGSLIGCYLGNQYSWEPNHKYDDNVWKDRSFRTRLNFFSHLRTFRGFLWKKIDQKDLYYKDGKPAKYSSDVGYVMPILDMTPSHRVVHLDMPYYFYNHRSPLNDDKIHMHEQRAQGDWFRSKPPYKMLEDDLEKHLKGE